MLSRLASAISFLSEESPADMGAPHCPQAENPMTAVNWDGSVASGLLGLEHLIDITLSELHGKQHRKQHKHDHHQSDQGTATER